MSKETKKPSEKKSSFAKKRAFKHGGYAAAITAVFIVIVILFNIGATLLAKKISFSVDLTSGGDYTISDENKDYIKDIKRDVNIVVCCDEDTYKNSYYSSVYNQGYVDTKGSYTELEKYFTQNARLLEEYDRLSKHITLTYADPQDPEFNAYITKYPSINFSMGDILVESSFMYEGEKVDRYRVLDIEDLFEVDSTAYASYGLSMIQSNRIETALTSAIYSVTADKSYHVTLITANGGSNIDSFKSMLEMNNYEFTVLDSLIGAEIAEDTDLVIISEPKFDYAEEELDLIDKYLSHDSGKSSALLYIGSADQSDLPNINEFLGEWGFVVTPECTVRETDSDNCYYSVINVGMKQTDENGYIDDLAERDFIYLSYLNTPVTVKTPNGRELKTLLEIPETAVACPVDAGEDWNPENAEVKGPFAALAVCTDSKYNKDNVLLKSSVVMLSSSNFITSSFNNYSYVGNLDALAMTVDKIVGRSSTDISFDDRTFDTETFAAPSNTSSIIMKIIFIGVIPVGVLAFGIFVWIRRRRS